MHLLWLKIYTHVVEPLSADVSNHGLSRHAREESDHSNSAAEAFEPMIAAQTSLEELGDAQHVAPWTTMSVRHLLGESAQGDSGRKSASGPLRSSQSGTTSSREAL